MALEKMDSVSSFLNEEKRRAEEVEQLTALQDKLVGKAAKGVQLVGGNRKILCERPVLWHKPSGDGHWKERKCVLVLLSDMLLLLDKKSVFGQGKRVRRPCRRPRLTARPLQSSMACASSGTSTRSLRCARGEPVLLFFVCVRFVIVSLCARSYEHSHSRRTVVQLLRNAHASRADRHSTHHAYTDDDHHHHAADGGPQPGSVGSGSSSALSPSAPTADSVNPLADLLIEDGAVRVSLPVCNC